MVWMCIGEEAFFSGLDPPRCFPDQYYLGDPTWYMPRFTPGSDQCQYVSIFGDTDSHVHAEYKHVFLQSRAMPE